MDLSGYFVHHVYFWLNDPDSKEDLSALVAGLQKLAALELIKDYHIGLPATTDRAVIDRSYAVSWLLLFATAEDQERYQAAPEHLDFVRDCSSLWSKVVVYDSVGA
jgi:hypothetical protein